MSYEYEFKVESIDYHTDKDNREYYPYTPSTELAQAVNLAIALQRPLLVQGYPGCGKTQLAYALARQLFLHNKEAIDANNKKVHEDDQIKDWPFYIWNVKSSSDAQEDGLYRFDAIERLRDAQLVGLGKGDPQVQARLENLQAYVRFGSLGRAIQDSNKGYRAVVLIDEVDKGSSDFANNLLYELDQFILDIKETGKSLGCLKIQGKIQKPIVIITSNGYRPLPEAFLRRCLYFNINFPDDIQLKTIVRARITTNSEPEAAQKLFSDAIDCFERVRKALSTSVHRPPSTSELIDFIEVLKSLPLQECESVFKKLPNPYLGILLKTPAAQDHFRNWQKNQENQ